MKIKMGIFGLALVVAILLRYTVLNTEAAQGQAGAPAAEITALLKERSDTLDQNLKLVTTQFRNGTVGIERVAQAEKQLTTAQLDAAQTRQERIAILKKSAATAVEMEKLVKLRYQTGEITMSDALQARADALDARIALLREEEKK